MVSTDVAVGVGSGVEVWVGRGNGHVVEVGDGHIGHEFPEFGRDIPGDSEIDYQYLLRHLYTVIMQSGHITAHIVQPVHFPPEK